MKVVVPNGCRNVQLTASFVYPVGGIIFAVGRVNCIYAFLHEGGVVVWDSMMRRERRRDKQMEHIVNGRFDNRQKQKSSFGKIEIALKIIESWTCDLVLLERQIYVKGKEQ